MHIKLPTPLAWILLIPGCVVSYIAIHWVVIIFGKFMSFMSREAWSDQFIEFVIAPGFAGYWSLLLPLKMFNENTFAPKVLLAACVFPAYGAMAGFALFTNSNSSILASVISVSLTAFAYLERDE